MDWIEQAVFTSAETDRSAGYQVVATSPGVCDADVRELGVWGPSHDALLESTPGAVSVNFHPLPGGGYCVSRTVPAGWEYSGRGGARIYTQCLIVSPETLWRFANNPFALLRAALASGSLRLYNQVPERLEPVRLAGRAAVLDTALVARLRTHPGPDWLASLVQAALTTPTVGVTGGPPPDQVIAGLINCLPPECRAEVSFSTGLRFSPRRPFRLIALLQDAEEQRRVRRLYDVAVLDLSQPPPAQFAPIDAWPRLIRRVLKSGRTSLLSSQFSHRQGNLAPEDLPAWGLQLLEELDASSLEQSPRQEAPRTKGRPEGTPADPGQAVGHEASPKPASDHRRLPGPPPPADVVHQAHHAHARAIQALYPSPTLESKIVPPSQMLEPEDLDMLEKLEQLDDLVYDAIAGNDDAMERLQSFWPQIRHELGPELLDESQEQYLRYALSIWEESVKEGTVHNPSRILQALDVLSLLFDDR